MGCVRLYLELDEARVPPSNREENYMPVIDCVPEEAQALKRRLQRQGYTVIAVPL